MKNFTITAIAPHKRFISHTISAPNKNLAIESFASIYGKFFQILKIQEKF